MVANSADELLTTVSGGGCPLPLPGASEDPATLVGSGCSTPFNADATAFVFSNQSSGTSSSSSSGAIALCLLGCSVGSGNAQCDVSFWLFAIGAPLLLAGGTIGNALTLVVMTTKMMRTTAFGTYIAALAIADTLVLWSTLPRHFLRWVWLVDVRELSIWSCRTLRFLQFTLMHTSAWLLVTVTAERFLVVYYPSSFRLHRKRRRALWVVAGVTAFHCIWNAHIFFTLGDDRSFEAVPAAALIDATAACSLLCEPASGESVRFYWKQVHPWLDMVKLSVLPFVLMLAMNFAIVAGLARGSSTPTQRDAGCCGGGGRRDKAAAAPGCGGNGCSSGATVVSYDKTQPQLINAKPPGGGGRLRLFGAMLFGCGSAKRFKGRKLSASESKTVMLLWVSFFYLITTAPAFVSTVMEIADRRSNLFSTIATVLLYTNNAANFILYCLSGATFRRLFVNTFKHSLCCRYPGGSSTCVGGGGGGGARGCVTSGIATEDVDLHLQEEE